MTKPRIWAVSVPGTEEGSSVTVRWDENASPTAADGAEVELIMHGAIRYRLPLPKSELRRLLAVAADWPEMDL